MSHRLLRTNRRTFLASLGASAAALPFVPRLEREARAATGHKRLILITTGNGTVFDNWRPTGGEHDFELSEILQPFAPHREDMVILDGVDNERGRGHWGIASLWSGRAVHMENETSATGWATGPTVDQFVAESIGADSLLPSLQIGTQIQNSSVNGYAYYGGENDPRPAEQDPGALFEQLFAGLTVGAAEAASIRARRGSVLDAVKDDLSAVRGKLGVDDKGKLEAHLQGIEELERRLDVEVSCEVPTGPGADLSVPQVQDAQIELVARAMACDLTRVVGIQWGQEVGNYTAPWLGLGNSTVHQASHDTSASGQAFMTAYNRHHAQKVADLVSALKSWPEDDGTVFDNTLIVWALPMSMGHVHLKRNVPVVILEGGNGYFDTGRYLRWGSFPGDPPNDPHGGEPNTKLLTSICHAMGQDVEAFGDPEISTGPLGGLT